MKYIILVLFLIIPLLSFSQDVLHRNGFSYWIGTEKVTKKEFKQQLAQNPVAFRQFKNAKIWNYTSAVFSATATTLILTDLSRDWLGDRGHSIVMSGIIVSSIFSIISNAQESAAIGTYNSDLRGTTRIAPTSNGVGLVYKF